MAEPNQEIVQAEFEAEDDEGEEDAPILDEEGNLPTTIMLRTLSMDIEKHCGRMKRKAYASPEAFIEDVKGTVLPLLVDIGKAAADHAGEVNKWLLYIDDELSDADDEDGEGGDDGALFTEEDLNLFGSLAQQLSPFAESLAQASDPEQAKHGRKLKGLIEASRKRLQELVEEMDSEDDDEDGDDEPDA